jgi:alanine-alpha-ketoisovalerate/valine-pyruvate aminotransferase
VPWLIVVHIVVKNDKVFITFPELHLGISFRVCAYATSGFDIIYIFTVNMVTCNQCSAYYLLFTNRYLIIVTQVLITRAIESLPTIICIVVSRVGLVIESEFYEIYVPKDVPS